MSFQSIIDQQGQTITITRLPSAAVQVKAHAFTTADRRQVDPLIGGVTQYDFSIVCGRTEMQAASWPEPPAKPDRVTMNDRIYIVQAVYPLHWYGEHIGYRLYIKG